MPSSERPGFVDNAAGSGPAGCAGPHAVLMRAVLVRCWQ
jgi:hypothetical protein